MKKKYMYRVYDHKDNYIQTYSSELDGGYQWARDCATRMSGRVDQVDESAPEEKSETIFVFSSKK